MGRYVDWGDVVAEYPALAKDKASEAADRYIVSAEGECDARLAPKFTVPFVPGSSNVPQIVRTLAVDLAYYRTAWQQKGIDVLKKYIDDRFKGLLDGSIALTNSGGLIPNANQAGAWTDKDHRTAFGIDAPENYSVSDAWLTEQKDERDGD